MLSARVWQQSLDTATLGDNQKILDAKRGDREASHLPALS